MKTEIFHFTGADGRDFTATVYLPDTTPKVLLQVAHGMTEHFGRYETLAQTLTDGGIAVAGFDLRGHGRNPGDRNCASMGENGWSATLEDMRCLFLCLEERFPGIPHGMLGFSLGSFFLREYLRLYPEGVAGAAIVGTGQQSALLLNLMIAIVKGQVKKAGAEHTTPLVRLLSFGAYNQKFKPNRTPSDWLCGDRAQLDSYRADPLVREDISSGLFLELLMSMKRTGSGDSCLGWNRDMPVLLLSGADDPVGDAGKGVRRAERSFRKQGLRHVATHLIPSARHDLFHEEESGAAARGRQILRQWLITQCITK